MKAREAVLQSEYAISGLEQPATIIVDIWGIPHIRAASDADVFLVQGFNAGRERLWQLDLWRKRGLGLLAADFGPGYLAQDRASRLFLYRSDMDAEWAAYGNPETRNIVAAFARGINCWIELTRHQPELLAPEFVQFGTKPQLWDAEDVVRIRSHARSNNILSEVARAHVMARSNAEIDRARKAVDPSHVVSAARGVDLAAIPLDVIDVYKLAISAVTFSPERMQAPLAEAWHWSKADDLGSVTSLQSEEGSNNWAISGTRTESGRPILANDPHRNYSLPALRYVVHLSSPTLDVIGAGEPCLPGVCIGHNGTAAFGVTIFPMDQEDLYVYETDPDDPHRYRYAGDWEPMHLVQESFAVKGCEAQDVALKFTRHGPVIFEDRDGQRAYAVRTVWTEPGGAAYLGNLNYLRSKTSADFIAAIRPWVAPPVNHVYADINGDIAWAVAGKGPKRSNWDGLLPVAGDGRYEWNGFVPAESLPHKVNPAEGFVATANESNAPNHPELAREQNEWSRINRIKEVLTSQPLHTPAQSMALQCDETSMIACRACAILASISGLEGDALSARDLLSSWDHRVSAHGRPAAALFEVWWTQFLKPALLDRIAPSPTVRALLGAGDNETIIALLERPDEQLGVTTRDRIIAETLANAMTRCRELLGERTDGWEWGTLHTCTFTHPAHALFDNDVLRNVGPYPVGGSMSTPLYAAYKPDSFDVINGASFRMVVDVGNWDNSWIVNAPGQSGDPASAHYDDHAPLWRDGKYVPLVYSDSAIDANAEHIITLKPI